jgi:predicted ester cyclase
MAVDVKKAYRRLVEEAFGRGNLDVYDETCAPSYRAHDPLAGDLDLARSKENCRTYRTAFPDLAPTILGCWAEGDVVVLHWRMTGTHQRALMDVAPTGARCTVEGISLGRFKGGKLVEDWAQWDALGLLRQIGVAPDLAARAASGRPAEVRPH